MNLGLSENTLKLLRESKIFTEGGFIYQRQRCKHCYFACNRYFKDEAGWVRRQHCPACFRSYLGEQNLESVDWKREGF